MQPFQAGGSGVVFDAERGLIGTNNHVVDGAVLISIGLQDGRIGRATLVGSDPATDIAILKTDLPNLKALPIGNSDQLAVGDFIVAVGNPFGLEGTATAGIVSGLMRSDVGYEMFESFIQIDAAVNPGNSGGALVNMKGELVGINTAVAGGPSGNTGIGFAIPIDMAKRIGQQILRYGEVRRGVLGLKTSNVTLEAAKTLGLENIHGALVTRVDPASPAERAGLKVNDLILSINGEPINSNSNYLAWIGTSAIGDTLALEVSDGKTVRKVPLTVSSAAIEPKPVSVPNDVPLIGGLKATNIGPGSPLYGKKQGPLVTEVPAQSQAGKTGLVPGDVIVSVDEMKLGDVDKLVSMAGAGKPIERVQIDRDGIPYFSDMRK